MGGFPSFLSFRSQRVFMLRGDPCFPELSGSKTRSGSVGYMPFVLAVALLPHAANKVRSTRNTV